ncbi:MAG: preprotein translocase subunit SecE [Clostridiales bacterium GWB2_37_7]|nr:MAG: preprotein translocase subunit SecE [Clostridiales bacterium GWB2_37_7]
MAGITRKIDIRKFYRETKSEIKKVSWPSRKELIQHTEVVVTSIILVGALLAVADFTFGKITQLVLGRI